MVRYILRKMSLQGNFLMVEAISGKIHSTEKFISQIYYLLGYGITISIDFRCYLGVASDCELRTEIIWNIIYPCVKTPKYSITLITAIT